MLWILLVVISAFLWALTSNFDKFFIYERKIKPIIFAIFNGLLGLMVLILIPFFGFEIFSPFNIFIAILAGFAYLGLVLPYYKACEYEEISRVIILWRMGPIFTLILAAIVLKEFLATTDYIGFIFLLAAAILVSRKKGKGIFKLGIAFYLLLLSSFLASINTILSRFLYFNFDIISAYIWIRIGAFAAALLLLVFYRKDFIKTLRNTNIKDKSWLVFKSFIDLTGLLIIGFAFSVAKAPLVSAMVNSLLPIFTFILASFFTIKLPYFIKEDLSKGMMKDKLIAMVLVLVGIYILYLG